ncbi:MAG: hypothetical protein H7331_00740 [Bacteroidia bacterium]|nr:hypothetical protein [Bacteroidia bacterium]
MNTITIYNSQQEAEQAQLKRTAMQTPIERLQEVYALIQRMYPLSERKPSSNKIYFTDDRK